VLVGLKTSKTIDFGVRQSQLLVKYVLASIYKLQPSMVLQIKPQEMVFGLPAEMFAHAVLRVYCTLYSLTGTWWLEINYVCGNVLKPARIC
jgi:hypothetical protein